MEEQEEAKKVEEKDEVQEDMEDDRMPTEEEGE